MSTAPTHVKICGITTLEDARFCAGAGADFLGYVQHEDSPRYVDPGTIASINEWIAGPRPVGVFVNTPAESINRICSQAGLELVQLHGTESPDECRAIDVPVIKAIHVKHDASVGQLRKLMRPYEDVVTYFLLDTHHTDLWGGTGESFNWRVARELATEFPIFLAGGINSDNVKDAVEMTKPFAVDLSSSVEDTPGKKNFEKLNDFFESYRDAVGVEDPY